MRTEVPRQTGERIVRWRRKPKTDRRKALIDATIRVIASHGINDCSLERVTMAAGVSNGLVRHHFGNKANLLAATSQAIVDHFFAVMDEAVQACEGDAFDRLMAFVSAVHDPYCLGEDRSHAWFGIWYEARNNPDILEINRAYQKDYVAYVEDLAARAVRERGVQTEPWRIARGLISLIDGFWHELMYDRTTFGPEVARDICADYLNRLFHDSGQR